MAIRPLDLGAQFRVFATPSAVSFPSPVVVRAHNVSLSVRHTTTVADAHTHREAHTDTHTYVERNVRALHVSTGRVLELGQVLKESIYGVVLRAHTLRRCVYSHTDAPTEEEEEEDLYERTGEIFAVKMYRKDRLRMMQGRTQEQPLMEIPIVQYLGSTHQNVLGQVECCANEEAVFLIMRYVEGGELYEHIEQHGPLDESLAREMFRQLLSALSHMQRMGIAHRDLSLENVLWDGEHWFVVIDFGMALRLPRHRQDCIFKGVTYNEASIVARPTPLSYSQYYCFIDRLPVCGKRNYIAPEVYSREEIFHPMLADMWALGVMLFIALTGVPPCDSASMTDGRFRFIAEGKLAELLAHWGISLSAEAVDILVRLLQVNPLARPSLEELWAHPWVQKEE